MKGKKTIHTRNRKVIDADNQKILDYFSTATLKETLNKYKTDGRWTDVSVDRSGDIILWEN